MGPRLIFPPRPLAPERVRACLVSLTQVRAVQGMAGTARLLREWAEKNPGVGLVTYDRKRIKIPAAELKELHAPLTKP